MLKRIFSAASTLQSLQGNTKTEAHAARTASRVTGLVTALLASAAFAPAMAQQVPQANPLDLGTMDGAGKSWATAVSADGTTVVGGNGGDVFRFVQGGTMQPIPGFLQAAGINGTSGLATAVNANGTVVVGWAYNSQRQEIPIIWTATNGASVLDPNNPVFAIPNAVSADGTRVVGDRPGTESSAFLWTQGVGYEALNTLDNRSSSHGVGISYDGNVAVYNVDDGNGTGLNSRAYRWTANSTIALSRLNNGNAVHATAVSGDGMVVVGYANDGNLNNVQRAFAWRLVNGVGTMTSLDILNGGSVSRANAVNRDGSVIVGIADIDGQNAITRGFRWTQATGMITVEQWLQNNGVAVGNNQTTTATGVSADGNVVVGWLRNGHAYVARGAVAVQAPAAGGTNNPATPGTTTTTAGLMDVTNYATSLAASPRLAPQVQNADLVMNGAHSSPLFMLLDAGQSSASFTGDGGYANGASYRGGLGAGEFGFGRGIEGGWTVRLAGGGQYARFDTPNAGNSVFSSGYVAPDVSYAIGGGVVATLSGYFNWGKADIRRGYLNGAANDSSFGSAATQTYGVRARVDWQDAFKLASTGVSPFVSYTYLNAQMNGYTETGGSFPVQFNGSREVSNAVRIGADATTPLNDQFALVTRFEYGHRFEKAGAGVSGQILGLSAFSIDGASVQQDWLRGGLGVSYKIGNGDGLVMVNTSNQTGKNTTWVSASYRVKF
ncbi:putative HAF family extracellular repeat protein [Rhizobium aquaticum]|uniref:HAF family extracellular repeat protein n=1 Tax=Rhizobium aquaticum TaxID=1549636 RepID=A0ABV2IXZ1_9HYPH